MVGIFCLKVQHDACDKICNIGLDKKDVKKEFIGMNIKKVKRSTLIIWLIGGFIFSIFIGITAGSMGFGSRFPELNLIARPFLCSNGQMSHVQHVSEIGTATYWTADWFCVDEGSGLKTELESDTVFLYAGSLYGLVLFVVLLIIVSVYWNSSIGPAKNDGLRLW